MANKKGFTFVTLLMVAAIIGLSALIGLKFYSGNRQERTASNITQDKAKNIIIQANAEVIQSLIQGALIGKDIDLDKAVELSQSAGLNDPFSEVSMNSPKWFPELADSPGEIQITLEAETFYIQGYGSDGFLANMLTVKK